MVRRKPEGHGTGTLIELLKGRQDRWESKLILSFGSGWGSRFPPPCTFPLVYLKGQVHTMLIFMSSPRMLVGAPWDGPSGDRRGDVYHCPVEGSHNAPWAKGHLGKKMPHSSTPNP